MALVELLRKDRIIPGPQTILGLILGFGGVILLAGPGGVAGSSGLNTFWALTPILAALSWAVGSVYSQKSSVPRNPLLGSGME